MNILLVGSGAREHAIAQALKRSTHNPNLFCFGTNHNPGIIGLSSGYTTGKIIDAENIVAWATKNKIDWAFIGPEAPLEVGVVDALQKVNIPSIGPNQRLAQLETSKSFTRNLLAEYDIPGGPKYKYFASIDGVKDFINELNGNYVVKVDGLMGGKGVKVSGEHLNGAEEGLVWCQEILKGGNTFLIEEKFVGQEFSLFSFCDGKNLAHSPVVQDHKRAFVKDTGPNTGGMGSYSDSNHSLPFLTDSDIEEARAITEATAKALRDKFSEDYKGVLYGGFIATKDGVKLIEYNARLGDPEAMNILALLESDMVELCQAIIEGNLTQDHTKYAHRASVCKYAVPEGYPENAVKNEKIDVSEVENKESLYYAAVDQREDGLYETGSRTVAVVGIAGTISEAEKITEAEINKVKGPLFHREDIGTEELIKKRVDMMNDLRK